MFCYNCGKKINDNDRFCTYCGAKIRVHAPEIKSDNYSEIENKNIDTTSPCNTKEVVSENTNSNNIIGWISLIAITLILWYYIFSQIDVSKIDFSVIGFRILPTCEKCDETFLGTQYHGGAYYSTLCEDCAKEYWQPFPYQNYKK